MSGHDLRDPSHSADAAPSSTGTAPGKRTLTQSIPPLQPRAVARLDQTDDIPDTRATIDTQLPRSPGSLLTERQVRKARRANPRWQRRLRFEPAAVGRGAIDSEDFARNTADKQGELGIPTDGVAGPRTLAAIGAKVEADRSDAALEATRGRRIPGLSTQLELAHDIPDTRATIDAKIDFDDEPSDELMDPFADDDPFGMHLIGRAAPVKDR